jgi:hypothetical protein
MSKPGLHRGAIPKNGPVDIFGLAFVLFVVAQVIVRWCPPAPGVTPPPADHDALYELDGGAPDR